MVCIIKFHNFWPASLGENSILKVADVLGVSVSVLVSKNLNASFATGYSHLTVAGTYPSFFRTIGSVFFLPTLNRPNLSSGVRSSSQSLGFSNLIVGRAPSPLKS